MKCIVLSFTLSAVVVFRLKVLYTFDWLIDCLKRSAFSSSFSKCEEWRPQWLVGIVQIMQDSGPSCLQPIQQSFLQVWMWMVVFVPYCTEDNLVSNNYCIFKNILLYEFSGAYTQRVYFWFHINMAGLDNDITDGPVLRTKHPHEPMLRTAGQMQFVVIIPDPIFLIFSKNNGIKCVQIYQHRSLTSCFVFAALLPLCSWRGFMG
jgi:hypothetical protein